MKPSVIQDFDVYMYPYYYIFNSLLDRCSEGQQCVQAVKTGENHQREVGSKNGH